MVWINYFEDIGEGRVYKGMYVKPNEFKNLGTGQSEVYNVSNMKNSMMSEFKSNTKWCGIGVVKYPDGSIYQGQTKDGLF